MDPVVEVAADEGMVATPVGAKLAVRAADQREVKPYLFATNGVASPVSIARTFP